MTMHLNSHQNGLGGSIEIGGQLRLNFNDDGTLSGVQSPSPADLNTKKLPTMDLFGALTSANGYQKLPSGLIIQWAQYTVPQQAATTFSLPIAFPNAGLVAMVTPRDSTVNTSYRVSCSGTPFPSNSQIQLTNTWPTNAIPAFVIAIGY